MWEFLGEHPEVAYLATFMVPVALAGIVIAVVQHAC